LLVKYAAKKTWPEKSQSWEHQGDSESIEAFANEFAVLEQLGADAEFVVMEKEAASSPRLQFFRVASVSPLELAAAEPRATASAEPVTAVRAEDSEVEEGSEAESVGMPNLRPVISTFFYMGKVAFIATVGIALMAVLISFLRKLLG